MTGRSVLWSVVLAALPAALASADLQWHQNGSPLGELVLNPGESVTVQLYNDDPVARYYEVVAGNNASPFAVITDVQPLALAGDLGYASLDMPDWWRLHCEWNPANPQPISVWGDHWDVTLQGIAEGNWSVTSGTGGEDSTLAVTVTPEPTSLCLLAVSSAALLRRRREPGRAS